MHFENNFLSFMVLLLTFKYIFAQSKTYESECKKRNIYA
jgi:hypothetical protein